ncbi:MAG TPA: glycosyltransferase family 2 protein [Polyangiaceae bacterium]|nr:glycosyltransferase family 2 protein [Polyangiaceae bacterium]
MDVRKLRELRGCPSGDAAAWQARYRPLVAEELRHREVAAPRVSAIVVAYRSADRVIGCLEHLRAQRGLGEGALEVILLDNGGLEAARGAFPGLVDVEVRMKKNVGLCPARNMGAALAKAPIISFIDDDGLIAADYYQKALRHLVDPSIVALRSRIQWKEHRYFTSLATHYDRGEQVLDDCLVTEGSSVLKRDTYFALGGFGDKLSPYEGLDFSFRLRTELPDSRIVYAPDVIMRHDYCDSWKKLFKKSLSYTSSMQLADEGGSEVADFLRDYGARRYPKANYRFDERIARALLGAVKDTLRFYGNVTGRKASYIPISAKG